MASKDEIEITVFDREMLKDILVAIARADGRLTLERMHELRALAMEIVDKTEELKLTKTECAILFGTNFLASLDNLVIELRERLIAPTQRKN